MSINGVIRTIVVFDSIRDECVCFCVAMNNMEGNTKVLNNNDNNNR